MYEGAEILNGDRAAVRKSGGCWYAYGLPYAGSSGIYRNESTELSAVVVLRQAKENRIRRMKRLEIIQNLYPETTVHQWERDFVEKALTILTGLAEEVPFYLLECRPGFLVRRRRVGFPDPGRRDGGGVLPAFRGLTTEKS